MNQPKVVAVIGAKKAGKTTTTERLVTELSKRAYKVAVIKYVPDRFFTIDTPGKDSYRFAEAGAKTVVVVSSDETVVIEKVQSDTVPFERLIEKCEGTDVVLVEGGKQVLANEAGIPKVAVVKTQEDAEFALENYASLVAFAGPFDTEKLAPHVRYANALINVEKLADIIEEKVLKP